MDLLRLSEATNYGKETDLSPSLPEVKSLKNKVIPFVFSFNSPFLINYINSENSI